MEYKVAVITGVTGQIGSYLLDSLLSSKEYSQVYGIARRVSLPNTSRISQHLYDPRFTLVSGDITDSGSLYRIFDDVFKHGKSGIVYEVYNLAAMSFVKDSFSQPKLTMDITGTGYLNLLECLKLYHDRNYLVNVFQMSSSEQFGSQCDSDGFQRITTSMIPNSPYAAAKLFAYNINRIYRESYKMNCSSGVIFNSESPRRGPEFVTRKITQWFARYYHEITEGCLELGNIKSVRDWTHAKDTVRAIRKIIGSRKDYVVASGNCHTVLEFMESCYDYICPDSLREPLENLYRINPEFYRPNEVSYLKGDATPLKEDFGWVPEIDFKGLVNDMMEGDISSTYSY